MKSNYDVVIIGGGIVACSIVYHLAKRGITNVVLVEMNQIGARSSGQSAAMVMHQTGNPTLTRLARESIADYVKLKKQVGLRQTGSVLYTTRSKRKAYLLEMAKEQTQMGIKTTIVPGADIHNYFPLFNGAEVILGSYCPSDGFIDQFSAMQFFLDYATAKGVDVRVGTRVLGIRKIKGNAFSVRTSSGTLVTSKIVNASGSFASIVAKWVNITLPIVCNKRHLVLARPSKPLKPFSIVEDIDDEWYFRPAGSNIMIGVGPISEVPVPKSLDKLDELRDRDVFQAVYPYVKKYVPSLANALYPNFWAGVRAMSKDGLPILGESIEVPGFINCCGLSAFGVTLAPICGRLVASIIGGQADTQQHLLPYLSLNRPAINEKNYENTACQPLIH